MDFVSGGNGSGDEHEESSNSERGKKQCHRHSPYQIQQLEAFFKECRHPNEKQRRELSRDLGLEPQQIKFWFQNKRTQIKAQTERADNNVLKAENEKIHYQNLAMKDALNNLICPTCNGKEFGQEDRQRNLQKLRTENALLKREYERVYNIIAPFMGKSSILLPSGLGSITSSSEQNFFGQGLGVPSFDQEPVERTSMNLTSTYQIARMQEMEKSLMVETVARAMEELLELLRVNEPMWIKSSTVGKYFLDGDIYNKHYPKTNHFKYSGGWIESSKDSGVVPMTAVQLIKIFSDSVYSNNSLFGPHDICEDQYFIYYFLDPHICIIYLLMYSVFTLQKKWMDIFPTIVTKARNIGTLDTGSLGGSLHLMHAKLHILSPLVSPREYIFLRYRHQLDSNTWAIVDTSFDHFKKLQDASLGSWRLPSGCMIQEMPNGKAKVTWVEHVQVDGKSFIDPLFKELIWSCQAFGARRWIVTLERMCERFAFSVGSRTMTINGLEGVIDAREARKNLMGLSHRMVKNFSEILSTPKKLHSGYLAKLRNGDFQVSVRENSVSGQPHGMIVCVTTSLRLPVFCENLFDFFKDEKTRPQWDALSDGSAVDEVAHIATGAHFGNCIAILKPSFPRENGMVLLQESSIDSLGGLVIYAPVDTATIIGALNGEDTSMVPILPSGFVISSDGHPVGRDGASTSSHASRARGSILTVVIQILMSEDASKELSLETLETMHTLMSTTLAKIKVAIGYPNLD